MNVNGYEFSEWTFSTGGEIAFARKDGKRYFIKRYNAALKPSETASPEIRAIQEEKFFRLTGRRDRINAALAEADDPTVVKTVETFVHDCHLIEVNVCVENVATVSEVSILSEKEKAEALLSAARAVALIHAKGLVHSDIKPSNLLMVKEGGRVEARLIDFDSSYFTDEKHTLKSVCGDDFYGAPETVANMGDDDPELRSYLSEKADIFSLGLTLYEYYTGKKYDTGADETRVWSLVCDGEKISLGDDIEEPLRSTIEKMLRYEPADRPSAQEVCDVIAGMVAKKTTEEKREAPKKKTEEPEAPKVKARGGAGVMTRPDDGYPLTDPWREDNIDLIKENLEFYGFVRVERISDPKGDRYYKLIKRNGMSVLRKKEQLILMMCAREKDEAVVSEEETSDTREVVNAETASADETAVEAPEAEEIERELPEDGVIAGECDICAPWDGHDIVFVRDTLVGLGCKKVERMNPAKKLYRIVFARESNVNTREECISRGYAVEKFPAAARGGVSERTLNKMWDGDSGSFDRSAMAAKRVSSIARCVHDGHKEYEVTFMTPSGKERKCILDYSSLRMLGLIV